MKFWYFLKIFVLYLAVQNGFLASAKEISYIGMQDLVKTWSSADEYKQSLKKFLTEEKKIAEFVEKKQYHMKQYQNEEVIHNKRKENDEFIHQVVSFGSPFAGAFICLYAGAASGATGGSEAKASAILGLTLGGIFGVYYYLCVNPYSEHTKNSRYRDSLQEVLKVKLRKDIHEELLNAGYITKDKNYPVPETKTLIDSFYDRVMRG